MPQNLTKILTENSSHKKSDIIILWHASRNSETLKSFWDEGIQAIGKGVGGQRSGFYVWNKKQHAISHFHDHLFKRSAAEGLLIGVKVDKNTMTYPNWQFDLEGCATLNPLFFKYRDQIAQIHNLEYRSDTGEKEIFSSVSVGRGATEESCPIRFAKSNGSSVCWLIEEDDAKTSGLWQAFVDKMCENSQFHQDYNKLLQESVVTSERLAVKYCGQDPLMIDELLHLQKGEKDSPVIETLLYTSSQPSEGQICPFIKAELARRKGARGS